MVGQMTEVMRMYPVATIFLLPFCPPGSESTGDPLEKEHHISTHRNYTTISRVRKEILFNPLN